MRTSIFVLLLIAGFGVQAETLYKSIDSRGGVIYSDQPIPGAKIVKRFDWSASEPGPRGPAADYASEVGRAEAALAEAERALAEGRTPLPGERKGIAGGGARLTEDYFQRVLALERAVESARLRLQNAITRASR